MFVSNGLLKEHVVQSNLIEWITAYPGQPLYDGHLNAARIVAKGEMVHPNKLHEMLFRKVPRLRIEGGKYRTCAMLVLEKKMPQFKNVPMLMEHWWGMVEEYQSSTKDFDESAQFLHAWFLCIHPYVDGNGRTARLVWNMLRVNKGLPWQTIEAKNKRLYYTQIHRIEEGVFRKTYPEVYS